MLKRIAGLLIASLLAILVAYASRYWIFDLWPREGLFGLGGLPPEGAIIRRITGGTILAPFDILLWGIGAFLFLSFAQFICDRLK